MSLWLQLKRFAISRPLIVSLVFLFFGLLAVTPHAYAAPPKNTVNVYLFWGDGCPHCAHAKQVLEPYFAQKDYVQYKTYEVYYNAENQEKMRVVGEALQVSDSGVPFFVVGDQPFVGFSEQTGDEIKTKISYCSVRACDDSVAALVGAEKPAAKDYLDQTPEVVTSSVDSPDESTAEAKRVLSLPLLGTIDATTMSLPVLTIVIALVDGFNPCAMWALLFIITLLIGMKDRRRMWLYGIAFIATSAAVYFLFMAAWLNLFMFIGHVMWLRIVIGLLAIGIGGYYLYDWWQKKTGCKTTKSKSRRAVLAKLKQVSKEKNLWIGLVGIIALAAVVNIIEMACSAGLPVLYTGILSSAGLASWQYYAYMLLYIVFFMLDDLIVFGIAMMTMKVVGINSAYTRTIRFVGGMIMVVIGILLIVAPGVLMLG